MGVAAEHEIDCLSGGVRDEKVSVVGGVAHEDNGLIGHVANARGDGAVRVGTALNGIFQSREPESAAAALDGHAIVAQHGNAVGLEGRSNCVGFDEKIVVSENGDDLFALDLSEQIRALPSGSDGKRCSGDAVADKIAGEKDEVGIERIDAIDSMAKKEGFGEFVHVNIAHLSDAQPVEGRSQARDVNIAPRDFNPVTFNFSCIEGQAGGRTHGCFEEAAARD